MIFNRLLFYKCKYNMEKEIDAMIEAENGKLKK